MGFSSGYARKTMTFGWLEIIVMVTIAGVLASTLTLVITKCMKGKNTLSGWEMQDTSIDGTVMGSFYNNAGQEGVWICGSDDAVSNIRMALRARADNSRPFLPRSKK